jgi:AbrB family looped-hinge helix DNA binding protein
VANTEQSLIEAKIGRQNRVVLPAQVRKHLGVGPGDYVAFDMHGDRITLVALELKRRR